MGVWSVMDGLARWWVGEVLLGKERQQAEAWGVEHVSVFLGILWRLRIFLASKSRLFRASYLDIFLFAVRDFTRQI